MQSSLSLKLAHVARQKWMWKISERSLSQPDWQSRSDMFRLPILIAIFAIAALPRISAAQSSTLLESYEASPGDAFDASPDARLNELVRRINQQEAELNELRQSLANDSPASHNRANPNSGVTQPPSISLLNPSNRVKLHAGLDTLMVFSTSRPFPSGTPLFLLPESPFGLETNTFDAHARQSYVGGVFTGPKVGDFQTGAQILTFFQTDSLSTDDYGMLVYYACGSIDQSVRLDNDGELFRNSREISFGFFV